jgi:hypothetical protein
MLVSRRAEIEAEAKLRGVHPGVLTAQLEQIIARVQSRALDVRPSESYGVTEQSKTSRRPQKDRIPKHWKLLLWPRDHRGRLW